MKILKNISLESVEKYYIFEVDSDVLELPENFSNKDFFEVPSYIQLVSTWIRRKKNYTLKIPLSKKIDDKTNRLEVSSEGVEVLREEVNYIATIMSWGQDIENLDQQKIEKKDISKFTTIIRSEMNSWADSSRNLQKGNILFLTCFDHFANSNGLLNSFYLDGKNFYDHNEFFFSPFNDRLSNFSRSLNKVVAEDNLRKTFMEISNIIYELMLNTHEWARTNEYYKELSPNVRGVYIKLHKGKIDNLQKRYRKSKGLFEYLKNDFSADSNGLSTFFEISVFDSGPGFIKRNNVVDKTLSIKDEVDIIKRCLTLHQTSASGHKSIVKGAGLDRISRILDGKGFLKIRTGKSSVYRDFIKNSYVEVKHHSEILLRDWQTSAENSYTEFNEVEGAIINILYPFKTDE